MTEPRTEAGKRLDSAWPGTHLDRLAWHEAIVRIEAEATAAAEQRLRAKVLALHTAVCACPADGSDPDCHLSVGPVLALLDSPEKTT